MSGGVAGESEQIEREKDAGQGLLAVPEIVLEVVAIVLEHVEGFVLYLPPGSAAGSQLGDGIGGDRR